MKRWLLVLVALLTLGLLAGCSSGPKKVTVTVKNMAFNTKTIKVKAGRPVRLTLINKDTKDIHDLSVEEIPVYIVSEEAEDHSHDSTVKEPDLHVSAQPNSEGVLEFIPTVPGTYTFICTVPGHEMAGMTGTLIVT